MVFPWNELIMDSSRWLYMCKLSEHDFWTNKLLMSLRFPLKAMFCVYDFMFLLQWNGWRICQIIIWNWPIILRRLTFGSRERFISHAILKKYCMGVIHFFLTFSKSFHFLLFEFFNNFLLNGWDWKLKYNTNCMGYQSPLGNS